MQIAAIDRELIEHEPLDNARCQVQLGSNLRRMMVGYLQPQDWIRVIGKVKVESQTGAQQWKAHEIVKISTQQAMQYANQQASKQALCCSIGNG